MHCCAEAWLLLNHKYVVPDCAECVCKEDGRAVTNALCLERFLFDADGSLFIPLWVLGLKTGSWKPQTTYLKINNIHFGQTQSFFFLTKCRYDALCYDMLSLVNSLFNGCSCRMKRCRISNRSIWSHRIASFLPITFMTSLINKSLVHRKLLSA